MQAAGKTVSWHMRALRGIVSPRNCCARTSPPLDCRHAATDRAALELGKRVLRLSASHLSHDKCIVKMRQRYAASALPAL